MGIFDLFKKKDSAPSSRSGNSDPDELELLKTILDLQKGMEGMCTVPLNEQNMKRSDWGYSVDNPVLLKGIPKSYAYLSRICTSDGRPLTNSRIGSTHSSNGEIVDIYNLMLDGNAYKTIYICPYGTADSAAAPAGLKLR